MAQFILLQPFGWYLFHHAIYPPQYDYLAQPHGQLCCRIFGVAESFVIQLDAD